MKLLEFNKLNPFLAKMTILVTIFISSFFFTGIKYFKEMLDIIVFLVLIVTLFIRVIMDILGKRGFVKNFDIFLSSVVVACLGKIDIAILMLIVYEYILFFNKDKLNEFEVIVKRKKNIQKTDISNVKIGDILILRKKELVKLECVLQDKKATFLTNDNKLSEKMEGDIIPVGYSVLENSVSLKAIQKYKDSITKVKDDILRQFDTQEQDYTYISNIMRVISIILIFIPNLLTGKIEEMFILSGASLLLIKDMSLFTMFQKRLLESNLFKILKNDIFVKDIDTFRKLIKIKNVVFEKTETLTLGEFRITGVETDNEEEFFKYLNYGEYYSNNRIANVIRDYKKIDIDKNRITKFKEIPQRGVECKVDGKSVVIGNRYFLKDKKIDFDNSYETGTVIYLAVNNKCLGNLVISDSLKVSTRYVIDELKSFGVKTFTIMSGDNEKIVNAIAYTLGIKDKYSNLTTDEKIFWIKHLKDYYKGAFLVVGNRDTEQSFLDLGDLSLVLSDDCTLVNADIYIKDMSLEKLIDLFNISKRIVKNSRNGKLLIGIFKVLCFVLSIFSILPLWLIILIEEVLKNIIDRGGKIYE